ncbi:hypothetical protein BHE74_00050414 [Ensete ventricosum]|nr:hypothetical protein BHE74_00050414 [Ensete ventricosum]
MRATASVGRLPSPPLSAGRNLVFLRPRPTSLPDPRVFASRSLAGTDPSPKNHPHRDRAHGWKRKEQGVGRGERGGAEEVHCEVDVVSWRERRVRAWILVNADVESVWSVLTDYERLADFVPNLVYRSDLPVNLRAVACRAGRNFEENQKTIMSMNGMSATFRTLYASSLGRFGSASEIETLPNKFQEDHDKPPGAMHSAPSTEVNAKWGVYGKACRLDNQCMVDEIHLRRFDGLLVIYEDLPSNLCSIRDAIEDRVGIKNDQHDYSDEHVGSNCDPLHDDKSGQNEPAPNGNAVCTIRQRPKVPGLQRDVEVLKAELTAFISKYGQGGFMPMRKQLRLHGRVDIEKAITRMARALEKWGGLQEVSRLLSLELRHPRRRSDAEQEGQNDLKASNEPNGQEKLSSIPLIAQDTQKWLMKLKDLDINWVE